MREKPTEFCRVKTSNSDTRKLKKSFVLSDQTVNQYGFVVLTSGINLERFRQNPVMLYNHMDDGADAKVIGRWENIRIEENKLMADPVFDMEDPFAKEIAGKVERGFMKGASVWVDFDVNDDVKLNVEGFPKIPVVFRSELMEGSIVPIPNNKNSIRLRAGGELITDNALAVKLSATQNQPIIDTMKKQLLFAQVLGMTLAADASEDHVFEATKSKVDKLAAERDEYKDKFEKLEAKLKKEEETKVTSLIDGAVTSGKLKADQKDHFSKLAKLDFDSTKSIIDGMVAHTTISDKLNALNAGKEGDKQNPFEGKGYKELMKSDAGSKYLAKLKVGSTEEKAEFKKLFDEAFGNG